MFDHDSIDRMQNIGPGISLFHYESLLSKVYRRDTRDSTSLVYLLTWSNLQLPLIKILGLHVNCPESLKSLPARLTQLEVKNEISPEKSKLNTVVNYRLIKIITYWGLHDNDLIV